MLDLLVVLKPFSIYDSRTGRRDLRPGSRINLDAEVAEPWIRSGHLERIVAAAPLFTSSTDPPRRTMKGKKNKES